MHYIAGALLLVQAVLIFVVTGAVDVAGLEYLAWVVWLVAVALLAASVATLRSRGQVREGRSFVETESLVATGVYRMVRHPLYLGWILMYVAVILFNPHWIIAVLGFAGILCVYRFTLQEEAWLRERFGQSYERYMRAVPRFNLLAGAIRLLLGHGPEDYSTR